MSFMANMLGNKALTAHSKGDYDKALELYAQAYEKGMNQPRLLRGYCVLLIRKRRFDEALEVLKNVEGIGISYLSHRDVVRHELVQAIVKAYEKFDKRR